MGQAVEQAVEQAVGQAVEGEHLLQVEEGQADEGPHHLQAECWHHLKIIHFYSPVFNFLS